MLWAITDFNAGQSAEGESSPASSEAENDVDALANLLAADAVAAKKKKSR